MSSKGRRKTQRAAKQPRTRGAPEVLTHVGVESAESLCLGLLEAAPDSIIAVRPDGRIALLNAQTEKVFGYRREELLGQPVEVLIPERLRDRHSTHRAHYLADPQTRPMGIGLDLTARRKDGTDVPVDISLSPMDTPNGMLVIAIVRDATEQKRVAADLRLQSRRLEEKVREMDDFTHAVSHDLKEPLRGIEAFAGFLLEDYNEKLDDQGKTYLRFLKQSAVRMKDLIHDLLALTALSRKEPELQEVDLNRVVSQVERDLEYAIRSKHAVIRVDAPLPTVTGDPTHLGELFRNLLSNAMKFNRSEPPEVRISARDDEGGFLRVAVADNGIGIDARYRERIFDLFERLHPQEEFEGTGAGLAICKKVVEGYGGRIWVESEPGQGSTFFVTLPKAQKGGS